MPPKSATANPSISLEEIAKIMVEKYDYFNLEAYKTILLEIGDLILEIAQNTESTADQKLASYWTRVAKYLSDQYRGAEALQYLELAANLDQTSANLFNYAFYKELLCPNSLTERESAAQLYHKIDSQDKNQNPNSISSKVRLAVLREKEFGKIMDKITLAGTILTENKIRNPEISPYFDILNKSIGKTKLLTILYKSSLGISSSDANIEKMLSYIQENAKQEFISLPPLEQPTESCIEARLQLILTILNDLAKLDDGAACNALRIYYQAIDRDRSDSYFVMALERRNKDAEYYLYQNFESCVARVTKNRPPGLKYSCLLNAANHGHKEAQFELAEKFLTGDTEFILFELAEKFLTGDTEFILESKPRKARYFLRLAAQNEQKDAQFKLALLHKELNHDDGQYFFWLQKAALNPDVNHRAIEKYKEEIAKIDSISFNNIDADDFKFLKTRAAASKAKIKLAFCYENGLGCETNLSEAKKLYEELYKENVEAEFRLTLLRIFELPDKPLKAAQADLSRSLVNVYKKSPAASYLNIPQAYRAKINNFVKDHLQVNADSILTLEILAPQIFSAKRKFIAYHLEEGSEQSLLKAITFLKDTSAASASEKYELATEVLQILAEKKARGAGEAFAAQKLEIEKMAEALVAQVFLETHENSSAEASKLDKIKLDAQVKMAEFFENSGEREGKQSALLYLLDIVQYKKEVTPKIKELLGVENIFPPDLDVEEIDEFANWASNQIGDVQFKMAQRIKELAMQKKSATEQQALLSRSHRLLEGASKKDFPASHLEFASLCLKSANSGATFTTNGGAALDASDTFQLALRTLAKAAKNEESKSDALAQIANLLSLQPNILQKIDIAEIAQWRHLEALEAKELYILAKEIKAAQPKDGSAKYHTEFLHYLKLAAKNLAPAQLEFAQHCTNLREKFSYLQKAAANDEEENSAIKNQAIAEIGAMIIDHKSALDLSEIAVLELLKIQQSFSLEAKIYFAEIVSKIPYLKGSNKPTDLDNLLDDIAAAFSESNLSLNSKWDLAQLFLQQNRNDKALQLLHQLAFSQNADSQSTQDQHLVARAQMLLATHYRDKDFEPLKAFDFCLQASQNRHPKALENLADFISIEIFSTQNSVKETLASALDAVKKFGTYDNIAKVANKLNSIAKEIKFEMLNEATEKAASQQIAILKLALEFCREAQSKSLAKSKKAKVTPEAEIVQNIGRLEENLEQYVAEKSRSQDICLNERALYSIPEEEISAEQSPASEMQKIAESSILERPKSNKSFQEAQKYKKSPEYNFEQYVKKYLFDAVQAWSQEAAQEMRELLLHNKIHFDKTEEEIEFYEELAWAEIDVAQLKLCGLCLANHGVFEEMNIDSKDIYKFAKAATESETLPDALKKNAVKLLEKLSGGVELKELAAQYEKFTDPDNLFGLFFLEREAAKRSASPQPRVESPNADSLRPKNSERIT